MKKTFIIIAVILTVAGIAVLAGAFFAFGADFLRSGEKTDEIKTYAVDNDFTKIEISSSEDNVTLKPSGNGKASVVCTEKEKITHTVAVENETLKIGINDKRSWFDFITFFSKTGSITVYLPAESYELLKIKADTGNVVIPDNFSFGEVDVTLSTGNAVCAAPKIGKMKVKAGTGNINIENTITESVELFVSTGGITVKSLVCKGDFSTKASTGKTRLTDIVCEKLLCTSSTGKILLKDTIAKESFNIKASTGDVRFENCDAGEIYVKTSTGDVTGTLVSDMVFITETSTGDVNVPKTVTGGRCEISTSTGDIDIRIFK